MKKILITIIALFAFTINVNALTVDSLGLSIDLPEEAHALTRKDKEVSYDFYKKDIYLLINYKNTDIYIRAVANPGIDSYTLDKDITNDVVTLVQSYVNTDTYEVIERDNFKWIKFNYRTKEEDIELIEYYLSWKDLFITITVQGEDKDLNKDLKREMDSIVESITLTGDGLADPIHVDEKQLDKCENLSKIDKLAIEIIICSIIIIITFVITRKKKR